MAVQNVRNMSDLYLELRSRIPVVAAQTVLGTQRIAEAQKASGLSNEAIARVIPISEKTWRRWKKAGAIPTAVLPAVAKALRLELVELNRPGPALVTGSAHLELKIEMALDLLEEVRDELLATRQAPPGASTQDD